MMYFLDTNVVSERRKARTGKIDANVAAWAESMEASDLFVSSITIMELELGILSVERQDAIQGSLLRSWLEQHVLRDCSPPCRARLPTSQAATVCLTDLRWPPWAETTSPAACNSSMPLRSMLIAALISRSCSTPHSGHCQMRLFNGIAGIL